MARDSHGSESSPEPRSLGEIDSAQEILYRQALASFCLQLSTQLDAAVATGDEKTILAPENSARGSIRIRPDPGRGKGLHLCSLLSVQDRGERPGPGVIGANEALDFLGRLSPIQCPIFALQFARICHEGLVLWLRGNIAFTQARKTFCQHVGAEIGKSIVKHPSRILRADRKRLLQDHVTGIEFRYHVHEGDSGFAIAFSNRGLDWRCPAVPRQQGSMKIDAGNARSLEDRFREDLTVGHHHDQVRPQVFQVGERFLVFSERFRLKYRDSCFLREDLDRRRGEDLLSPDFLVGLGIHRDETFPLHSKKPTERGECDFPGCHEDDSHDANSRRIGDMVKRNVGGPWLAYCMLRSYPLEITFLGFMKGFLATLIVVCAIIGGIWFAYEPYIKPMLEKGPVMSPDEAMVTENGSSKAKAKPTASSDKAKVPSAQKSKEAKAKDGGTAAAKAKAPAKKSELDLLLEEKYPMPEILPLLQIVDNWKNVPARAYPQEIFAKETVAFQLVVNGQAIGSSNVAPGTPLKPVRLVGDQLTIGNPANPGMSTTLPVGETDFKERVQQRYDEFVAKVTGDVTAKRAAVKKVVEADPAKLAMLKGEKPPAVASNDSDPRFAPVKSSLQNGEAASVTLEEATSFTWNGNERVGGEFAGSYDTVTVHFEVATIFGRFPVDYKALIQGGRVVAWIDPITEERI